MIHLCIQNIITAALISRRKESPLVKHDQLSRRVFGRSFFESDPCGDGITLHKISYILVTYITMGITESYTRPRELEHPNFDLSKCGTCRVRMKPDSKWYFYNDNVYCSKCCRNTSMSRHPKESFR